MSVGQTYTWQSMLGMCETWYLFNLPNTWCAFPFTGTQHPQIMNVMGPLTDMHT